MASFSEQMSGMEPWRRTANIVLLVAAIAVLVLGLAGVLATGVVFGAEVAVVVLGLLLGPRSPLFRADGV